MKIKVLLAVFTVWMVGILQTQAQDKFGYFDENYVVSQLPEYKAMKTEMDTYSQTITTELQSMEKKYEEKAKALELIAKSQDTPISVLETKGKELDDLAKQIRDLQESAQKEYQGKLGKKLEPVMAKVKKAVDDVAKEQGGIFIFRKEALLFDIEENNISDLVLKKLGVTPTTPVANRGNLKSQNKIGYFSAKYVIPQLPAYKQADADVKTYEKMLRTELENMVKDYQKKAGEADPENPAWKALSETAKTAKIDEIKKTELKIQETEAAAQKKLQDKYGKLMEPITKQIQDKLNEVAKENGYTFVFSMEALLHEKKDADLSDLVLKKMGVTPATTTNTTEDKK